MYFLTPLTCALQVRRFAFLGQIQICCYQTQIRSKNGGGTFRYPPGFRYRPNQEVML